MSSKLNIKQDDMVLIISGKDRGKKGKVITCLPQQNRVIVEGRNIIKKHVRPKKQGEKGQIVEVPAPLDASNVKLICPKCKQPTRVGYKLAGKNKFRICKKCEQEI